MNYLSWNCVFFIINFILWYSYLFDVQKYQIVSMAHDLFNYALCFFIILMLFYFSSIESGYNILKQPQYMLTLPCDF